MNENVEHMAERLAKQHGLLFSGAAAYLDGTRLVFNSKASDMGTDVYYEAGDDLGKIMEPAVAQLRRLEMAKGIRGV